jgi:hypothetical protein
MPMNEWRTWVQAGMYAVGTIIVLACAAIFLIAIFS